MKKTLSIIIVLCLFNTSLFAREKGRHVLVTKLGSYELDNSSQSSSRNFTTDSDAVIGLEYEWHMSHGLSIGGEFFYFENDYSDPQSHDATTSSYLFNVKYHFNHENSFQPFIGAGLGLTLLKLSNDSIFDFHAGGAHQFMAGFTYRFKHVGIYAEYKLFKSKPEDNDNGTVVSEVDVSGKGLLLGVSVLF